MKSFVTAAGALAWYAVPALAAESEGAAHKDMTPWLWANFVILCIAFAYLIKKFGLPFFENRSLAIRRDIDEARKLQQEAEARTAEVNARLAKLGTEIESIRVELRNEQARERERLKQASDAEIARIEAQAEQSIDAAAKAARVSVRRAAAEAAVQLAEEKLKARMTPEIERQLTESFVRELPA